MLFKKIFLSSAAGLLDQVVLVISTFLISPVLIHGLGEKEYGLWLLIFSITSYLNFLDLGMRGTAVRFLGAAMGSKRPGELAASFSTFRTFYLRVGAFILLLSGSTWGAPAFLSLAADTERLLRLVGIAGGLIGISFVFRVYPSVLRASINYHRIVLITSARIVLFTVLVLLFRNQLTILLLLGTHAGLILLEQTALYVASRPYLPTAEAEKGTNPDIGNIVRHTGNNILLSVSEMFRWNVDTQIAAHNLGLPSVTQLGIGMRIPMIFYQFVTAIFGSQFIAAFAQLANTHDSLSRTRILEASLRISTATCFVIAVTIFFVTPGFIERWLGPGFDEAIQFTRSVILSAGILWGLAPPLVNYLVAESHHGGMARGILVVTGIHIALSLFLSQTYGLRGIAFALALEFLLLALCVAISAARHSELTFSRIAWLSFVSPLLLGGALAIPLSGIMRAVHPETYPMILAAGALVFVPTTIAAGFFLLDRETRRLLFERLSAMRSSRPN